MSSSQRDEFAVLRYMTDIDNETVGVSCYDGFSQTGHVSQDNKDFPGCKGTQEGNYNLNGIIPDGYLTERNNGMETAYLKRVYLGVSNVDDANHETGMYFDVYRAV